MESGGVGLVKVVMVSSIRRDVAGESDGGFEIAKRVSERTPTMNQYNFYRTNVRIVYRQMSVEKRLGRGTLTRSESNGQRCTGQGVYTVSVWAVVEGSNTEISQYPMFHGIAPPQT